MWLESTLKNRPTASLSKKPVPPGQVIDSTEFSWIPAWLDRAFLHQKYTVERASAKEIAAEIFSSKSTVLKYLKHHGIAVRDCGPALRPRCVGYGLKNEKRQQVAFKREQDALSRMAELRSQGFTYESIAQILNSMKVPTKTHKGKWHRKTVNAILRHNA